MNNKQILKDSIFKIGKVISVDGRLVKAKVDKTKNTSHLLYKGELLRNISVGGYIKIVKGFTVIIGKVKGEYVLEEKTFSKKRYGNDREKISRTLEIELLGFFQNGDFKRGIKELPLIDNECYLLESSEFNEVHDFVDRKKDKPLTIGSLSFERGQEISVGINSLFASHIGIFGNTGSGKSYTLAKIYSELFKQYKDKKNFKKNAHFLLMDFNGEYSSETCITSDKKVYNLSTKKVEKNDKRDKFPISESDLINTELVAILADATDKTQKPFISRSITFYEKVLKSKDSLEYFKNILKKRIKETLMMSDKVKAFALVGYLKVIVEKTDGSAQEENLVDTIEWNNKNSHFMPKAGESRALTEAEIEATKLYKNADSYKFPTDVLSKVIHFLYLQIIYDVYTDKAQNEHISPAINKLKSKKHDIEKVLDTSIKSQELFKDSNFIVVNLFDVNLEMKKTLPLLFSKKIYSEHKSRQKKDSKMSLNIIVDEAHNILSKESVREAESWKDYRLETFEEIIKEGRKFGVFLTIASQRPSDISSTIISQLHNYFLHRLINNNDISAIERTISYLDKLSVESLSILPTGTCVLAGLLAQIPVVLDIGEIQPKECEPNSKTPILIENWED